MEYIIDSHIKASMCDNKVGMSIISAFTMVEDAITELLGSMQIDGVTLIEKYGATWVFTKNKVVISSRPKWRDKIRVRSFISGFTSAKMFVDTEVVDENGNEAIKSHLEMCALDINTGRVRKTSTVGLTQEMLSPAKLDGVEFDKFVDFENAEHIESVKVRSTNIDYLNHTNNVEYLRFILNLYSADEISSCENMSVQLDYKNQSFEGYELNISKFSVDDIDYISIVGSNDKKILNCIISKLDK